MKELYEKNKLFFLILLVVATGLVVWYFAPIVICIIIAGVIAMIGTPLVDLLNRIRIRRRHLPRALRVVLALLMILTVFLALLTFVVPLIIKEANLLASVDTNMLLTYFQQDINNVQDFLKKFGILAQDDTLVNSVKQGIIKLMDIGLISNVVTNVVKFAGTLFFYFFTVLFLTFFFLMEPNILPDYLVAMVPQHEETKVRNVLRTSKKLLSRYFLGLIAEVLSLSILVSSGLLLIGVEGAVAIGFFAGVMNIVPYLGYFLASTLAILLAITGVISAGSYVAILPMALKTLVIMIVANLIDNSFLQPFFFGKSVNARPVEIFLVIIAAGFLGGITGMIVAVPGYTFLRIIAREFIGESRMVRKLTERM